MDSLQLRLVIVDGTFAVCKLDSAAAIPDWAMVGDFFSITRSTEELSLVCREDAVPESIPSERGWSCLRVAGSIPFSTVGVLASLTVPLAAAGISVFAMSTFDTDYLLVKQKDLAKAVESLRIHGHFVE